MYVAPILHTSEADQKQAPPAVAPAGTEVGQSQFTFVIQPNPKVRHPDIRVCTYHTYA